MIDLAHTPHRRFNPLTREWILVSPHRTERPWQGQTESIPVESLPVYDPACYLCPGNARAGGHRNPPYDSTYVFTNDFAALKPDTPEGASNTEGLLIAEAERGICRVVCFSPDHSLTLARMSAEKILPVVEAWTEQYAELVAVPFIRHIQIFENRGAMMGCSNPHPHGQIWANSSVPTEVRKEQYSFAEWKRDHGSCLLCDYLALELRLNERIVCANDSFVLLVPYWAVWPFETMLLARRCVGSLPDLTDTERRDLADMLRRATVRYDNLFHVSFPYSMGFHQQSHQKDCGHLHAHYHPPLLRSATVRKFLVGYEFLAMPQRDLTPEAAAERLRALPEIHWL